MASSLFANISQRIVRLFDARRSRPFDKEPDARTLLHQELERTRRPLDALAADQRPALVFFAPDAGVGPHFAAQCLVARTMQELGHRVLMVRCFDVYPRCVVMDSVNAPIEVDAETRTRICEGCAGASLHMTSAYGLETVDLRDLVDDATHEEVERTLADLPQDLSTVEIDGIRFGRLCGAEAALTFKTSDFTGADPAIRALIILHLRSALLSHRAMQRLMSKINVARLLYFNEYAMLLGASQSARKAGVPVTCLSQVYLRAVDRRRITFFSEQLILVTYRRYWTEWPLWRDLALAPARIVEIGDDSRYRISMNSSMVYSPVRSGDTDTLFDQLGLSQQRRTLVAFTSSLDEIGANTHQLEACRLEPDSSRQPFRDQIEWIEALIARVEPSSDLQLVVRIHPREGANRRENVSSSHLITLRERFSGTYENVRFVWPGETTSSYDLMELADVGLTGWSSTALEMARFGVPVVAAFDCHTPMPFGDAVAWSPTVDGYFDCLEKALRQGPDLAIVRYAHRWMSLRLFGVSIDLSDVVPAFDYTGLPPFHMPAAAKTIEQVVVEGRSALDINRAALEAHQGNEVEFAETDALMREIRRNIWLLCAGNDRPDDFRLYHGLPPSPELPAGYDAAISADNGVIEFRTSDRVVRRRSLMVERLAALAAQSTPGPAT